MKRTFLMAVLGLVVLSQLGKAQQANQNINVLPVYFNETDDPDQPIDPLAYLKGDLFLQRQVEPTIAVSTRNPDHLIAFFNDYRAVDIPNDVGVGEDGAAVSNPTASQSIIAKVLRIFGKKKVDEEAKLPDQVAASEAWVGCSRSYDGGLTWSPCFVPGGPFDYSQASRNSPVFGLEAATDPIASAAPCGVVYVAWLAFTRGGTSMMVVSRYQDLNNLAGGDTWVYQGTAVMETGNNATNGYFLDKPFLAVDPWRESGGGCGHNIYASYTTFNGLEKDGKFKSKVTFARSTGDELGFDTSFDVQKLNAPYQQNQGTWIAIDPRPGTPSQQDGGGTVYLFWRHFFDPNAILMARSTDFGNTFKGNPTKITGDWDLETYDQLGISTTAALNATPSLDPAQVISFRSNAFPTAAVSSDGTVLVAWQERVDTAVGDTYGLPAPLPPAGLSATDPIGTPRIVMMKSSDQGKTWTDSAGLPGIRRAVDLGRRDHPSNEQAVIPEHGFGALPQPRDSGPQVMPALSCGGGRCMLTYYESRGHLVENAGSDSLEQDILAQDLSSTGFISGIDRVMDLRAALLDPATGQLLSTTQVSRYTIAPGADASYETVEDISPVLWPCTPDNEGEGLPDCDRALNVVNKPQSAAGTTPFIGDYNFLIPTVSFVPDGQGWRWATEATDVPYRSFHAIWADNRNLIPPQVDPEWPEYEQYTFNLFEFDDNGFITGFTEECPVHWGAKNTDVLTARIDAELILSAPTTHKQVGPFLRSYPINLTNGAGGNRFYLITTNGASGASFSQDSVVDDDGNLYFPEPITQGVIELLPYSSRTVIAYLAPGAAVPVTISVYEVIDGVPAAEASGTVTLNADATNGALQNQYIDSSELHGVIVSNPLAGNPLAGNPLAGNPLAGNPLAGNPLAGNPLAGNYTPTDSVTWTVSPGSSTNTHSGVLAQVNVDNPELLAGQLSTGDYEYALQLVTYRESSYGGVYRFAGNCEPIRIPQAQVISNIATPPGDVSLVSNPLAGNPLAGNPLAGNPLAGNPLAGNATFTVAPADSPTTSSMAQRFSSFSANLVDPLPGGDPFASNDGTLKALQVAPEVKVTLLVYRNPLCIGGDPQENHDTYGCSLAKFDPDIDPPALVARSLTCDEVIDDQPRISEDCDIQSPSADLVIGETADVLGAGLEMVQEGVPFLFPAAPWTLQNIASPAYDPDTGIQDPIFGRAKPENGPLTIGVYLSTDEFIVLPNGQIDPTDQLLSQFTFLETNGEFPAGATAPFSAGSFEITVPDGTPTGAYYLMLTPDDGRQVSESDELNNPVAIPVWVEAGNQAPTVNGLTFTGNASEGEDVTFSVDFDDPDGTAPGDHTFEWNFGDATAAETTTEPNVTHVFVDDGTYDVSVRVADADGAEGTYTLEELAVANSIPTADPQSISTPEDTSLGITLTGSDAPGSDPLTYSLVNGTGTSAGGLLAGSPPNLTYTPAANFVGDDSFEFKVCETDNPEICSAPAAVQIQVTPVNDPPTAGVATATVDEDGSVIVAVTVADVDGDALSVSVTSGPANGTATPTGNASITYVPDADYCGPDTFTYTVSDGNGGSATATVTIMVTCVNDNPTAGPVEGATVDEEDSVGILVPIGDVDGDTLGVSVTSGPSNGTAIPTDIASITYEPNADYCGPDAFTYTVSDGNGGSASATVTVTVTCVNDAPEANPDTYVRIEEKGGSLPIDAPGLLANDTDVDNFPPAEPYAGLTVELFEGPQNGTVEMLLDDQGDASGGFLYTPNPGYFGPDGFSYRAYDGELYSAETSVSIAVEYGFIGLLSPWKENPVYSFKLGSALPVRWQYSDPATGLVVESSGAQPIVRVRGIDGKNCSAKESAFELIRTPGNSTYQYDTRLDIHQLNWDSTGVELGFYNIYVGSGLTGQENGPFCVKVGKN